MGVISLKEKSYYFFVYFFISVLVGFFSPVFGYVLSIVGLIFSSKSMSEINRKLFVLASLFFFFIIYVSRDFEAELREDLSVYYMVLDGLRSDFKEYYKFFGGGVEIGWPVVYAIFDSWVSISEPEYLSIINTGLCIILLYFWVEFYLFRNAAYRNDGALIWAFIIAFLGIVTLGYLQRQAISIILMLYALYSDRALSRYFFIFLSILFHVTSLPLFVVYYFLQRYKIRSIFLFVFSFVIVVLMFRLFFYDILTYVSSITDFGRDKIAYYRDERFSVSSIKTLAINFIIFFMIFIRWRRFDLNERNMVLVSSLSYVLLSGIPLLSERLIFVEFYLLGFFIYYALVFKQGNSIRNILKTLLFIYVVFYAFYKILVPEVSIGSYWIRYPAYDFIPGYYLL